MNRAQRRELERRIRRSADPRRAASAPATVTLRGGPMDGWAVKPDAPALRPDWYDGFLEAKAAGLVWAPWESLTEEQRDRLRRDARQLVPPGRYELEPGGRGAVWTESA